MEAADAASDGYWKVLSEVEGDVLMEGADELWKAPVNGVKGVVPEGLATSVPDCSEAPASCRPGEVGVNPEGTGCKRVGFGRN